jgi:hypothetical protein
MKKSRESAAKRKESKSVLPEIQATFSKWKGNTEKSRQLKKETVLPRPRFKRMKHRIKVLAIWSRMFVK